MMETPFLFNDDWKQFMDVSYDGFMISDGEGRIVYLNPASERMDGVRMEDILGRHAGDLKDAGVYETSVTMEVLRTRKPSNVMEFKGDRLLLITGMPIFENRKIKWVVINMRDFTELNNIQRDVEKARRQAELYKRELDDLAGQIFLTKNGVVFNSSIMRKILAMLERIAPTDVTVLLEGESGTGKDVLARWLHYHSQRVDAPFLKIDCGVLSESLLESELFGYEKGAFTGAKKDGKVGLVEAANGGTLFLDEVGELPLQLQVKLLRLLQDQTFIPVGGVKEQQVNVRIIAATNRDLARMVKDGSFRKDLYFRLKIVPVKIPPIRERTDDVTPLILHFLKKYNEQYGVRREISNRAFSVFNAYPWPGNVREISNTIERLVVVTSGSLIDAADAEASVSSSVVSGGEISSLHNLPYKEALDQFEMQYIKRRLNGEITLQELADALGISVSTLKRKLRKYGVSARRTFDW